MNRRALLLSALAAPFVPIAAPTKAETLRRFFGDVVVTNVRTNDSAFIYHAGKRPVLDPNQTYTLSATMNGKRISKTFWGDEEMSLPVPGRQPRSIGLRYDPA